ncbi:diguanylate cyclase [Bacillus sp. 3255]|uniref:sensor domain-containing diguanylate cyclase n=1 Tax=Bacillus sp. 3255 TaxID=2817904 RepID=UPI00285E67BE|nr:diguanylate cyclase [Bacillus sp. 3255]MDR6884564.1 diguanylate cyclase (GGDEF)-like protein [Bacillus sp. 3255]
MGRVSSYFSNQTLKMRFQLWAGGAIVALAVSILVPFYYIEQNDRVNEAQLQLKQVITLQGLYIERWAQEKLDAIKRFALSDNAKFHRIGDLKREFQNYGKVNSEFESIQFVEKDGYIRIAPDVSVYVGAKPFFAQVKDQKKSYISSVDISPESGKPMIMFAAPVLGDADDFQGAVLGVVTLDTLNTLMKQLSFGETGEVYVLDADGQIVTRSMRNLDMRNANAALATSEIVEMARKEVPSNEAYAGFHGEQVYGQYLWSKEKNWIVVGEVTKKEVLGKLYQMSITIILISLVALICSILAVFMVASRIEKPVRSLLRATKIIQKGSYDYQIDAGEIRNAPIELRQLVNTFNMMAEKLKRTISLLEHYARMDPLTEIHNRRYMMSVGNDRLHACLSAGQTSSVIMMDIDHFKKINDTYGHQVGDSVLSHVASILKEQADANTIVARYGGEEFIILCLRQSAQQCASLAETILEHIRQTAYRDEKVAVPLTASIGIAEFSPKLEYGTMILEDMVSRADHALYRAKSAGRNRVELDR